MAKPSTLIRVYTETKEALADLCHKNQTYDDIINKMLKEYKPKKSS